MKELHSLVKGSRSFMMTLYSSSTLLGLAIVAQAYLIAGIVDRVFLKDASLTDVWPLLAALLVAFAFRAIFSWLNGRTGIRLASSVKGEVRKKLLNKWAHQPLTASVGSQAGRKVSVIMDAVDGLDGYYSKYVPQRIETTLVPLMILLVLFKEHWFTGMIILITAPFIPIFMALIGVKTKEKSEDQMEKLESFSGTFLDVLQGLTTLKLFGKGREKGGEIKESSLNFREATMEVLKTAFLSSLMLEFISMLSIGLIALEVGLRLIVFDSVSFYTAFFVLILAPEFYLSMKQLGSAFHTGRGSSGSVKAVKDELERDDGKIVWGEDTIDAQSGSPVIGLKGVGHSYSEGTFHLQPLTVHIEPFSKVAIIGESGSGKTTLLHILSGLIDPSEGEVVVNGKSRRQVTESSWFGLIAYISQNPYIFAGTIEENMAAGSLHTAKELEDAAEKAGLSELISTLEDGFQTVIGEGGRGLSGGEKQRIALARAFLRKPSIVLLDEPTTGLDLKTESILQQSIKELSQSSTIVTVAHRLHTIRHSDQILVLKKGRLIGKGTHEELLKELPEYERMITVQKGVKIT
ncbi:thiol reductant ABC exporter subunit CydD [Rossellomorea marisflavi]|uniref:thiol reductant ABC exporter subunit CydD n=1 Tax=Rossellomorea marisflavi TaxID=189381 RepID=UPI00064EF6E4|nr:thiol reductant ABC exporter subunit CydD [Rossellomorea marisflavi]KML06018.1 ABC transporter ATP-binding protein [Rossellomorea marisflavi]TYO71879.1 thiol reductant ABC exporter subunit CydD [Rossellomorea marisflavi]